MNDGATRGGQTTRWWLNPALARLAFGDATQAPRPTRPTFPPSALLEIDLADPQQREFGDYELIDIAGRGGMGVVYRARQRGLDREVALKLLSSGNWASEEFIENFRREAKNAALLQHPNIVVVHEMGEHAGLIYYAMQLVRGRSLSQRLDHDGPLPPRDAARMLRTIAEAVDYAHRLGVLHLDLKPGNILINENGEPLVADFGLARRLEQAFDHDSIAGTPSYMAPEQASMSGPALSPATDVWGLGAVLYEMLTGHPPFEADTPATALRLLQEGDVRRPSRYLPVPPDLEAICLKCLRRHPSARYISARALADDLGRYLEGRAVSVRPLNALQRMARWARREKLLAATVGVAVLMLVTGLFATLVQKQRADANAATASERLWESRREAALRLEQDGKGFDAIPRLLQNIVEEEQQGRRDLASLERRRIGLLQAQGAVLIDEAVIADATPMAVDLSADGALLAIAMNDRTLRWYDTATLRERGRVELADLPMSDGEPRSPVLVRFTDATHVQVTFDWYANLVNPANLDSWLVDLDQRSVLQPPAAFADFADASFSSDGRHAVLRNRQRRSQFWQVSPWKPLSPLSPARANFLPWLIAPGGRHVVSLRIGLREVQLFAPDDLDHYRGLRVPGNAGISAWAISHDGRTLALGDYDGRAFLVDLATARLRTLPIPRGRQSTWVAFSEDDAWLATANQDGSVHALDVATGESLVSGNMQHDFPVQRVGISHREFMLVAAGEGATALWRLPRLQGPRATVAQRIPTNPMRQDSPMRYSIGWSFDQGLLANAGLDGQVRLWRMPRPSLREVVSASQISERLWFDGRYLPDVEMNKVRVADLDGRGRTPWLELEQPPGFAELVDDGRLLLLTVGTQLRVLDAATLHIRHAIPFANTPQRLLSNRDGSRIVLAFGERTPHGFGERLQVVDGRSGRRLPGETVVAGPLRSLVLSDDSSRLLAIGPASGSTTVFDVSGVQRRGEYPHDPYQPVMAGAFRRRGTDVLLVTGATDPRLGEDWLIAWDPRTDTVRGKDPTGRAQPLGVIDTAGGAVVAGREQALLYAAGRHVPAVLERLSSEEASSVLATSPDGRLVARSHLLRVQLYDSQSGAALGPPLQAGSPAMDLIVQLAFSNDGLYLLARTQQGRSMVWPLPLEARPAAAMARELERLGSTRTQQAIEVPSAQQRLALRRRDPGPWLRADPRPRTAAAAHVLYDGLAIPLRAAAATPMQVDLSRDYTIAPFSLENGYYSIRVSLRGYPIGLQRLDGVDFDMRGFVEQSLDVPRSSPDIDERIRKRGGQANTCYPLPQVPLAAVHALLLVTRLAPTAEEIPAITARFRYRDGSQQDVQLLTSRDLPGYGGRDQSVPLVLTGHQEWITLGPEPEVLPAPRIANPHPAHLVRCVQFLPYGNAQPFGLVALTAEPARGPNAKPSGGRR